MQRADTRKYDGHEIDGSETDAKACRLLLCPCCGRVRARARSGLPCRRGGGETGDGGCTLDTTRGAEPCVETARWVCVGKARLRTLNPRVAISVTQGVDRHPAPHYKYSVTCACVGKPE